MLGKNLPCRRMSTRFRRTYSSLAAVGDPAGSGFSEISHRSSLVFKESVNNIARHSECTRADIELRVDPAELFLKLTDNGRGFDTSKKSEGHGLRSMRSRAEGLGGVLEIDSSEGGGTSLTFRIPLSESEKTGFTGRLRPT